MPDFPHLPTISTVLCALICTVMISGCKKPNDTQRDSTGMPAVASSSSASRAGLTNAEPDKIVVYYFHGTKRCSLCLGIQKAIEQTIDDHFSKEVDAGMLVFEDLDYEEDANKHFVDQFQLSFSSLIVTAEAGGKTIQWENANKVWDLAPANGDLKAYVEKTIRAYLKLVGGT